LGALTVLLFAALGAKLADIALWPAVVLHAAMTVWCLACLLRGCTNPGNSAIT
jgi:hypothetical protein